MDEETEPMDVDPSIARSDVDNSVEKSVMKADESSNERSEPAADEIKKDIPLGDINAALLQKKLTSNFQTFDAWVYEFIPNWPPYQIMFCHWNVGPKSIFFFPN